MTETPREDLAKMMRDLVDRTNAAICEDDAPRALHFVEGTRDDRDEQLLQEYPFPGGLEDGLLQYSGTDFEVRLMGETHLTEAEFALTLEFKEWKPIKSLGAVDFDRLCTKLASGVQLVTHIRTHEKYGTLAVIQAVRMRCLLDVDHRSLLQTIHNLILSVQALDDLFLEWNQRGDPGP